MCHNWQAGKCRKWYKCKFMHVGPKGAKSNGAEAATTKASSGGKPRASGKPKKGADKKRAEQGKHANAGSTRCRHDYAGKKCPYGD